MDHHDTKNFTLLRSIVEPNDVVVDVGAHLGTYTSFFQSLLKDTGKIYSIELSNQTYQNLQKKFGNKTNTVIFNYAVSDVNGEIPFYEAHDNHLNNIMGHDVHYKKQEKKGVISSIRLDTLLETEKKIKLVKIDVEGAEHLVLNGMEKIIDKVDYILVECHLQEYWNIIKDILLKKYSMTCINNSADAKDTIELNEHSDLMYQCFCKKK